MRDLLNLRVRFVSTYDEADRIWALFAPLSLLVIPVTWLALAGLTLAPRAPWSSDRAIRYAYSRWD